MNDQIVSPLEAIRDHLRNHPGVGVLVGSNTSEKDSHLSIIARNISDEYGIPIALVPMSHLFIHPSPIEDGNGATFNSIIKANGLRTSRPVLRDPTSPPHQALRTVFRSKGIPYYEHNTIIIAEDSLSGAPKKNIEERFLEKLAAHGVNPELLTNIETHDEENVPYIVNGVPLFFVVDYGMIKEAVGTYVFHDLLRQSALEGGYGYHEPLQMADRISCSWNRLDDDLARERPPVTALVPTYLFAPDGLNNPLRRPVKRFAVPKDFQSERANADHPIGDDLLGYMVHRSFRRVVFEKLLIAAVDTPLSEFSSIKRKAQKATPSITDRAPQDLFVAQVTPGNSPHICDRVGVEQHIPSSFDEMAALLAMEFPSANPSDAPRTASVIVVPPTTPKTFEEHMMLVGMLTAKDVVRQIDPRYGNHASSKIVINHAGCFDAYRDFCDLLTDAGYNGNHYRDLSLEGIVPQAIINTPGVKVDSDRYGHMLSGNNEDALFDVCARLTAYCLEHNRRSPHQPREDYFYKQNVDKPDGMRSIVAFMAANHEAMSGARSAADIGHVAAEIDAALGWGGMTKYPGKTLMDTYLSKGGKHLFASTTHDLALLESPNGLGLPSVIHRRILRRTIATREMDLIGWGEVGVSAPGGLGTTNEDIMMMLAKKPIVFYDRSLNSVVNKPWEHSAKAAELRFLFGEEKTLRLIRSPDACVDEGVALATRKEQMKEFVLHYLTRPRAVAPRLTQALPSLIT